MEVRVRAVRVLRAVVRAIHPAMAHQHLQDAPVALQVVRADVLAHVAAAVQVRVVADVQGHAGQDVLADALALVVADVVRAVPVLVDPGVVPAVLHHAKADVIKVVHHHVLESVEAPLAVAFVPTYVTEDSVMEVVRVLVKPLVKGLVSIPAI